jgi:hypothetical protein
MIFTIFSALAGILIFAIWSDNNFYVYAQQSYLLSSAAKLTNSTGNYSNATTTTITITTTAADTPIDQQQQRTSTPSSSSVLPSIQFHQSSPLNPITTDDGGFSAGLRDGEIRGFIDAKKGIDNNQCGHEHSNSYCVGYKIGYRLTLRSHL